MWNFINTNKGLYRTKIAELPLTARATLFSIWLRQLEAPKLSTSQLEFLSYKIEKSNPPGSMDLPKGWKIFWNKELIEIKKPN